MNLFKFEMNSIFFLAAIVLTITAWIGFEFYHRQGDSAIDPEIKAQSESTISDSFDSNTLKLLYENNDRFYENTTTPSSITTQ